MSRKWATAMLCGALVCSEEMRPEWFDVDKVPFDLMWPDDRFWFPLLLAGKSFTGYFCFRGHDTIVTDELLEVDSVPSILRGERRPKD